MVRFPLNHGRRLLCALPLALLCASATAQAYPDPAHPLRIVVPFGAGTSADAIARAFGKAIAEVSNLPVVIDNKPGADSVIGVRAVLNAPADGQTLLLVSSSTMVLNPLMVPNLPFDMLRDFVPLAAIGKNSPALNLGTSLPFHTVAEFIEAARARPGKFTYASASATSQFAGMLLEARTGIEMLNVPYKTTAAALTALAAGEVDVVMVDPGSAKGMYGSGRVRAIAIGAPARLAAFPQLPTLTEAGVADYQITSWFGTYFPAKTAPDKVAAMRTILAKAAVAPSYAQALAGAVLEPFPVPVEDIDALTRKEIAMWGEVLRKSKLRQVR